MYWVTVTELENDYEGELLGKRIDPLPDWLNNIWSAAVSGDPKTHSSILLLVTFLRTRSEEIKISVCLFTQKGV